MHKCYVDRATGRPFWPKVGTCCCGTVPLRDCTPLGNSCGCSPCGSVTGAEYFYRISQGVLTEEYNLPTLCCCGPSAGHRAAGFERNIVHWLSPLLGCTETDWLMQYQGAGGSWTGTQMRCFGACPCSPNTIPISGPIGCAPGSFTPSFYQGLPPPGFVFQGYYRQDCDSVEYSFIFGDSSAPTIYLSQLFGRHRIDRGVLPACIQPGCRRGACCCGTICLADQTPERCAFLRGQYKGDGVSCLDADCAHERERGACCRPDETCVRTTRTLCDAAHGIFFPGVECGAFPCPPAPQFACCLPSHVCQLLSETACAQAGGVWHNGLQCAQVDCTPPLPRGACCLPGGICQLLTSGECGNQGGIYRGDNTDCATSPCTGACCYDILPRQQPTRNCAVLMPQECASHPNSIFLGFGTTCSPNPCGVSGTENPIIGLFDFVRPELRIATREETVRFGREAIGGCAGCGGGTKGGLVA